MAILDPRLRLAIDLALAPNGNAAWTDAWEAEGRKLGMTGAEIDAARQGRGFDVQTSRALALALACRAGDARYILCRRQALRAGLPAPVCREIERLALRHDEED
jgi:hypothetical protein